MTEVETPSETPVVEEVGTQEVTETEEIIETPAVAAAAEEDPQAGGDAEDAAGKQTRAQKKMMKAMNKLNLKHVPGIMKVVMRRGATFSSPFMVAKSTRHPDRTLTSFSVRHNLKISSAPPNAKPSK